MTYKMINQIYKRKEVRRVEIPMAILYTVGQGLAFNVVIPIFHIITKIFG